MTRMNVRIFENITVNFKNITVKKKEKKKVQCDAGVSHCALSAFRGLYRTYMYML